MSFTDSIDYSQWLPPLHLNEYYLIFIRFLLSFSTSFIIAMAPSSPQLPKPFHIFPSNKSTSANSYHQSTKATCTASISALLPFNSHSCLSMPLKHPYIYLTRLVEHLYSSQTLHSLHGSLEDDISVPNVCRRPF